MWILLLDKKVLLSVLCLEETFGFYDDAIREDEVRSVFVVTRWNLVDKVCLFVDLFVFISFYLRSNLVFES